jgi:hypothetical protein
MLLPALDWNTVRSNLDCDIRLARIDVCWHCIEQSQGMVSLLYVQLPSYNNLILHARSGM